jgi:hypothetical protein
VTSLRIYSVFQLVTEVLLSSPLLETFFRFARQFGRRDC